MVCQSGGADVCLVGCAMTHGSSMCHLGDADVCLVAVLELPVFMLQA